MDAKAPTASFRLLAERVDDEEYDVDHREGFFYIRTNHEAEQFRLMRTPVTATGREHWVEVLAEQKDAPLEDIDLFRDFFVASYRERGLPVMRVFALSEEGLPGASNDIRFPDPAYEADGDVNRDFAAATYRYAYQSLVRPPSVFEYDVGTGASMLLKEHEVPGGFDASLYASERLWFEAGMGRRFRCRWCIGGIRFKKDGSSPLYVYGYGSYGYALPLGFGASRLAMLDRGAGDGVCAYSRRRRAG